MTAILTDALEALSTAHGPSALIAAFRTLQRAVKAKRTTDTDSQTLGGVVMEAVALAERLEREGMSREDARKGIESLLCDRWPKPKNRTEPWKYRCATCDDYGLEMRHCPGDTSCGREFVHAPHTYGIPCWCPNGRRHDNKRPTTPDDVVTRAAKQTKPTRWGR